MNEDPEWVAVFHYIQAMFPQQRFDEFTPDAWYEVLGEYDMYTVKSAVNVHAAKRPFISPAEIIAAIRDTSADWMDEFVYEPADPDETAEQYLANRRRQIQAVRIGQRPPALALAAGRKFEDVEGIKHLGLMPSTEPARRPGPFGVACPRCQAPIGKGCRTTYMRRPMADVHPTRLEASRRA
jgi:hypothetical protein